MNGVEWSGMHFGRGLNKAWGIMGEKEKQHHLQHLWKQNSFCN